MADKKTSDELNGAPIQSTDMFRIARINSNYKLRSNEIFCENISSTSFAIKLSSGQLIPGRNYIITDGITPDGYLMVTATNVGIISNQGFWIDSNTGLSYACIFETSNFLVSELVNDQATVFKNPNFSNLDWQNGDQFFACNFSETIITNTSSNNLFSKSTFVNCFLDGADGCTISNSQLQNVIINYNGYSQITIENCILENCIIEVEAVGITLSTLTINGGNSTQSYTFNKDVTNGIVIAGQFSTCEETLDMSSPSVFNSGTSELTLPIYSDWVGIYKLSGFSNAARVEYIFNGQTHTPIKFVHNDTNGDRLNWDHSSTISGAANNQNIIASHHSSNSHIETVGSYVLAIRQQNGVKSNFMLREIVNFNN